ncbi:DUF4476 domain-containing protein [Bacteroides ihuae]|uniref:DUF4476 domain-containing protein n=1 Tax=Bacteroides ihuae TaxID=1852362 RepID=UPI0008DAA2F6|nr:DUF4476 domain-containing protein [Bacteroides ihuae]
MRKLMISLSLLLVAFALKAAPVYGIRIESTENPIIVFVEGTQISIPTMSCFIANLSPGNYQIEAYEVEYFGRNDFGRKGRLIYHNLIYFSGNELKNIRIESNFPTLPSHQDRWTGAHSDRGVMDNNTFNSFFSAVKAAPFKSDKMDLIETAVQTSAFTIQQCKRLVELNTFDDDKIEMIQLLYPRIVDKQNFFMLLESLSFISSKDKINDFIKGYNSKYN